MQPVICIIAGPNGAGKSTFARVFLPKIGITHFLNADLIAAGLSPLAPSAAALSAGRLLLSEWDSLAARRQSFAFESTLSGKSYLPRLQSWKESGGRVILVFLKLASVRLALKRISSRVKEGGHAVPPADVKRRFTRGWDNFLNVYQPLADEWLVYDNSGLTPQLLQQSS